MRERFKRLLEWSEKIFCSILIFIILSQISTKILRTIEQREEPELLEPKGPAKFLYRLGLLLRLSNADLIVTFLPFIFLADQFNKVLEKVRKELPGK